MPTDVKKRLADGTISLIPLLQVSKRDGGTYSNDYLYCHHCGHFVPPRSFFTQNQKYECRKCENTSVFIIWGPAKSGGFNAELAPIH